MHYVEHTYTRKRKKRKKLFIIWTHILNFYYYFFLLWLPQVLVAAPDISTVAWVLLVTAWRIWFPAQGSNPVPLYWEQGVLTTGPSGEVPWNSHLTRYPVFLFGKLNGHIPIGPISLREIPRVPILAYKGPTEPGHTTSLRFFLLSSFLTHWSHTGLLTKPDKPQFYPHLRISAGTYFLWIFTWPAPLSPEILFQWPLSTAFPDHSNDSVPPDHLCPVLLYFPPEPLSSADIFYLFIIYPLD